MNPDKYLMVPRHMLDLNDRYCRMLGAGAVAFGLQEGRCYRMKNSYAKNLIVRRDNILLLCMSIIGVLIDGPQAGSTTSLSIGTRRGKESVPFSLHSMEI